MGRLLERKPILIGEQTLMAIMIYLSGLAFNDIVIPQSYDAHIQQINSLVLYDLYSLRNDL